MNRVNSWIAIILVVAAVIGYFMKIPENTYFNSLVSMAVGFFFGGLAQTTTPKPPGGTP